MINKKGFGAEVKLNDELMSRRLVAKSGYDLEGNKIVDDKNISIPEKNKELIAKLEKELEKDREFDNNNKFAVPDWYDGPDGKYYKAGPKTLRLAPTIPRIDINKIQEFKPLGKLKEQEKDKDINIEKDFNLDINKDINKDKDFNLDINKDKGQEQEEEYYMAEGAWTPYQTKDEILKDKLEMLRKEVDLKQIALKKEFDERKELEDKQFQELDKKQCEGRDCTDNYRRETESLIKGLRERIERLEKPAFLCRNCGVGIIHEGDNNCQVCGNEIVQWHRDAKPLALEVGVLER